MLEEATIKRPMACRMPTRCTTNLSKANESDHAAPKSLKIAEKKRGHVTVD